MELNLITVVGNSGFCNPRMTHTAPGEAYGGQHVGFDGFGVGNGGVREAGGL